jgi:two-component system, chemotaxis family, chemotaxis protein CheY
MSRRMLIVHESTVMRKILKSYAQAELSDILVDVAATSAEGVQKLQAADFDVVLSALEMSGLDGIDLRRSMRDMPRNCKTPVIITTSTDTPAQRDRLAREGIEHVLMGPGTAEKLAKAVDRAIHPRELRNHHRLSIPETEALLVSNPSGPTIRVHNISRTGLLGELQYSDELVCSWKPDLLHIIFSEEYGRARAESIQAVKTRIEVMSWAENDAIPDLLRLAWRFTGMPNAARNTLEMILDRADQEILSSLERESEKTE